MAKKCIANKTKTTKTEMKNLQKSTIYSLKNADYFPDSSLTNFQWQTKRATFAKTIEAEKKLIQENTFNFLQKRLYNRFQWQCNDVPTHLIEEFLAKYGMCCGFIYKNEFCILPCYANDQRNIYGEWDKVSILSFNGDVFDIVNITDKGKGILLRSNFNCYKEINIINQFSNAITDVFLSIVNGAKNLKLPFIVSTTREDEQNARDFINKIYRGEPAILVYKEQIVNNLSINENTYKSENLKALRETLDYLLALFDNIIGIPTNKQIDKKERITVGETILSTNVEEVMKEALELRKDFCKKVKNKFNVEISVEKTIITDVGGQNENSGNDIDTMAETKKVKTSNNKSKLL